MCWCFSRSLQSLHAIVLRFNEYFAEPRLWLFQMFVYILVVSLYFRPVQSTVWVILQSTSRLSIVLSSKESMNPQQNGYEYFVFIFINYTVLHNITALFYII